jgi:LPPG:FO 2-phospho-L-lactate transferase
MVEHIPAEFSGRPVVALCGGIGGSKLALGLHRIVAGQLTVIVNTGDDFEHLGLSVSPDVDTVLYTLAGLADPVRGWGRRDETWTFMAALAALGGETWFQLGDEDLATHIERTRRLRDGEPLSAIIADFACAWGIAARVLPMSDDKVRTMVETDVGVLPFQDFFVRRQCGPRVKAIRYDGAEAAVALPGALEAIGNADLAAIVLCPSNPWLSIDPLLAIPALRSAIMASPAPVIAVSPIVAGRAIKGPTAKIMAELGVEISAAGIARHYGRLIDGFIVDEADAGLASGIDCPTHVTNTVMESLGDREQLALCCLEFAARLRMENARRRRPVEEAARDR